MADNVPVNPHDAAINDLAERLRSLHDAIPRWGWVACGVIWPHIDRPNHRTCISREPSGEFPAERPSFIKAAATEGRLSQLSARAAFAIFASSIGSSADFRGGWLLAGSGGGLVLTYIGVGGVGYFGDQ